MGRKGEVEEGKIRAGQGVERSGRGREEDRAEGRERRREIG
jgi:hypothetical protein